MKPPKALAEGEASITCFVREIPQFVERELTKRYETLHSSLPFFKIFRSLDNVSCYVAWHHRHPVEIILFSLRRKRVEVLNEMIEIEPQRLKLFADYIFENFPAIEVISFNALRTSAAGLGFPFQQYNSKDTFVITLPETPAEYTASIGKSTRASILHQTNLVKRNFPTFTSEFFVGEEIRENDISDIVRFSESRIESKGVNFKHDVERIVALSRICGFVSVFKIDGRLCAGSINYRIGRGYFGEVIAYDPHYEKYGLGKLCTYQTICESIVRGGKKFYLGGGAFGFKERMLAKRLDMDQLQIYRSYGKFMSNLTWATLVSAHGQLRRLKMAVHQRRDTLFSKIVFRCFYAFRNRTVK